MHPLQRSSGCLPHHHRHSLHFPVHIAAFEIKLHSNGKITDTPIASYLSSTMSQILHLPLGQALYSYLH